MKKILIAIPCMDQVPAVFAQSLATLERVEECYIETRIGSLIYSARNDLAKDAVNMGADYVFWMDSDMTFPSDALKRMFAIAEEHENTIVTGLYFRRVEPFTPTLFDELSVDENGDVHFVITENIPDGLFEVEGCGFGCVLTPTHAFLEVAQKYVEKIITFEAPHFLSLNSCFPAAHRLRECYMEYLEDMKQN